MLKNLRLLHANSTLGDSHQTAQLPQTETMKKRGLSIANVLPPSKEKHGLLSPRRAFVVQFRESGDGADLFAGRVEHVVTGHTAHFHSMRELTRFMRRILETNAATPEVAGGGK